jgi:threonine-phosphate decarboxylase
MKTNGHGGDVYAASRELGRGVERLIDFSASINPLGPAPSVWRAIINACHVVQHYPDPICWDLREKLASHWRCPPDRIVVGNGSSELIYTIPRALGLRHCLVIGPTFSEYSTAMFQVGGQVTMVCADRGEGYRPPLDKAMALLREKRSIHGEIDAMVLCNPNSPTGQACHPDDVMKLARSAGRRRIWMIVDETFADYCPEYSIRLRMSSLSHVVVLRSLTKFHGLPGLRVGYAVGSSRVVQRIRRQLPPWSVNAMGQVAALAALNDARHSRRSLSFMGRERKRLIAALARLPGCTVFPSQANFLFLELPAGWHAGSVTARLRRQGLLIRDCSTVPGGNDRSIRVAVRTRRENIRLVEALFRLSVCR